MFALVSDGAIYLKVDDSSIPDFESEGSQPFTYARAGRAGSMRGRGAGPGIYKRSARDEHFCELSRPGVIGDM